MVEEAETYYIGISKKCCRNCETLIEAINEVSEEMNLGSIKEVLETRDAHGYRFRATIPEFMEPGSEILAPDIRERIEQLFLRKVRANNLREAFNKKDILVPGKNQVHERSKSPPDMFGGIESPKMKNVEEEYFKPMEDTKPIGQGKKRKDTEEEEEASFSGVTTVIPAKKNKGKEKIKAEDNEESEEKKPNQQWRDRSKETGFRGRSH